MRLTSKLVTYIIICTGVIVIPAVMFLSKKQNETLMAQAHIQARTLYKMVIITRQWVAENKDRVDPDPAIVTKEIGSYAAVMSDFRIKLTSHKLMNMDNKPDPFEKRGLDALLKGDREYQEILTNENNKKVYRYMAPLFVNKTCLNCHTENYKVGEIRGGVSITVALKNIEENISKNNKVFYSVGILTFISIIVLVSIFVRQVVLRHIRVLTESASSFMAGDYSVRTNIKSKDEIEELSNAFDNMSENIQKNDELMKEKLNEAVGKYVDILEELKEKNVQLESVSKLKTDILDSVSHEIRTPLTKILSFTELLEDRNIFENEEQRKKSMQAIKRNAKNLNHLFNEIITLSRLEHGNYNYHLNTVRPHHMIKDCLKNFESDIETKKLNVDFLVPEDFTICVDTEGLHLVLNNLIGNAVKYNCEEGSLEVNYFEDEKYKGLIFKDSGVGIPDDDIDKITRRFFRSSNVKRDYSGTGLGLSIVLRVLQDHNAVMEVKSIEGEFTEFKVKFPKRLSCDK